MKMLGINKRLFQNPYLLFAPFLVIYILIVLRFHNDINVGDEVRYMLFAQRLLNGSYSPPFPNIDLTNGPGFPILLMPFVGFNLPVICITLMNALLYYLSIIFVFKSLQQITNWGITLTISLFWACYYNSYEYLPLIYSEILSIFLVSLFLFSIIKAFNPKSLKQARAYIFLAGITFGYLVLTKFIFGYVLLIMFFGTGIMWIFNRHSVSYRRGFVIMVIALACNLPYLAYTHQLTGKLFYWGSAGGDSMYWMTTPYTNEYGNWESFNDFMHNKSSDSDDLASKNDSLISNHYKVFKEISNYNNIERDDLLKSIAIQNIINHPFKFLQNCISNIGRILFNYPYSYNFQKPGTLLRIPPNGIIVFFALICLVPSFANWRKIIYPIRFMLFVTLLYLGGSVLGSAETRMFTLIVPVLLIWIAFTVPKSFIIKFKWKESEEI
jgi:hypothetical protein